ncbi:hypothetical protein EJ03DRAFT_329555 [Teratosphaeria nubilosa]|uniref:Uncharacterized protein n=1 Tax=Teratosphaeria nubilosa TaxID=161662 RepID=A0A6G1L245_9PEZI|nr:hypothetical protein EJ03DRAFT_329555 [Teratosphaeria nubilosa]
MMCKSCPSIPILTSTLHTTHGIIPRSYSLLPPLAPKAKKADKRRSPPDHLYTKQRICCASLALPDLMHTMH